VSGGRDPTRHRGVRAAVACAAALLVPVLAGLPAHAAAVAPAVTISGLDLHDGTIVQYGATYYMYGTRYRCGFTWGKAGTPFCGFGVSTSKSLAGPWGTPKLLFSPSAVVRSNWATDNGKTWNWVCGSDGAGCFNPRMLHRPDGVWVLWFNAPGDTFRSRANAYWVMGCNGPAGPCGSQAGGPHGSTHKPALYICADDGDFSVITSGASAAILCSMGGISEEVLDHNWANGTGVGTKAIPSISRSMSAMAPMAPAAIIPVGEGVGAFHEPNGSWEMTYSLPGCGYCSGPPALKTAGGAAEVRAGYATAPGMTGPWTARGVLSPAYCTGQPRTVFTAGGVAYEWVDRWTGSRNETAASIRLEPMAASPWSCS
jgi:hypothetical protein